MKELLIIIGTVVLACLLAGMIVGDTDSLKIAGGALLEQMAGMYEVKGK